MLHGVTAAAIVLCKLFGMLETTSEGLELLKSREPIFLLTKLARKEKIVHLLSHLVRNAHPGQ